MVCLWLLTGLCFVCVSLYKVSKKLSKQIEIAIYNGTPCKMASVVGLKLVYCEVMTRVALTRLSADKAFRLGWTKNPLSTVIYRVFQDLCLHFQPCFAGKNEAAVIDNEVTKMMTTKESTNLAKGIVASLTKVSMKTILFLLISSLVVLLLISVSVGLICKVQVWVVKAAFN